MARIGLSRALAESPTDWVSLCRRAELVGIASAHPADLAGSDCFVDAAITLTVTERLPVVVSVALPTRSALQTASAAAALESLAPGRFMLGLGIGNQYLNETAHAVPYDPPVARLRGFHGAVRELLRAPAGQAVTVAGRYVRASGTGFGSSAEALPIVIGGHGTAMVRLAATVADGLLVHLLTPLDVIRQRSETARATRSEQFRISAGIACSVDPDEGIALRRARAELAAALAIPRFLPRLTELAGEAVTARFAELLSADDIVSAALSLPDETVRQFILVATPDRLPELLTELAYVDTAIPVPVGLFALRFPALGLTPADVAASRAWLLSAMGLG